MVPSLADPRTGIPYATPEHCLVNGGVPFVAGKSHVSNGQDVSFKEPCGSNLQKLETELQWVHPKTTLFPPPPPRFSATSLPSAPTPHPRPDSALRLPRRGGPSRPPGSALPVTARSPGGTPPQRATPEPLCSSREKLLGFYAGVPGPPKFRSQPCPKPPKRGACWTHQLLGNLTNPSVLHGPQKKVGVPLQSVV